MNIYLPYNTLPHMKVRSTDPELYEPPVVQRLLFSIVVESPIKILKSLGAQPSHMVKIFTLVTETVCPKSTPIYGLTFDCP
jgi:hypothetical protein